MSRLLLLLLLAAPAVAEDVVDWTEAGTCTGRVCSIRGRVVAQEDGGGQQRLYLDADRRDAHVTLMRGRLVSWPRYAGGAIVATGPVDRRRADAEMLLRAPDAIALVDAAETPVPGAPTPTPGSGVEEPRDRVRSLEEKIERLERGQEETR